MFFPSNEHIIFVSIDFSFIKIISYCLNPNFVLNLCANVVLQLSIKIMLGCFLDHLLIYVYEFNDLKDVLM